MAKERFRIRILSLESSYVKSWDLTPLLALDWKTTKEPEKMLARTLFLAKSRLPSFLSWQLSFYLLLYLSHLWRLI